jgi:cytochrome c biogenesis protein CcmG, thiol:disulfide interchange protein DsbE
VADVSFEPQRGIRPADSLARHARTLARVTDFSELTHTRTEEPLNPLQDAGLRNPDGQPFALDRFAGEVTILEFWARWCAPCRLTLPVAARVAAWAQAKNLPVHVVLVNTAEEFASVDAARPEIKRFLRWADISMATALDLDGSFHRRFGGGLPLTIVISPNGQVAARHGGFDAALEESLRREVTDLVRARDASPSAVPPMTQTGPAGGRGR